MTQENAIKKAAEDMKFYKLELINREHSYNNMFGNNPNVGLMNPMGGMGAMKVAAPPASKAGKGVGQMNNMMS